MSFDFDTGQRSNPAAEGIADAWMDAVTDMAGGPDAPRHKVLKAAADQIINDIWNHKSTDGVRRMFWKHMALLDEMSCTEPATHDLIVENLHERLCALKETSGKPDVGPAPVSAAKPLNLRKPAKEYDHEF